jgi:hypothetical protein
MMGPRRIAQDLCRSVRGLATLLQYLSSSQDLSVAIGLLAAESSIAKKGKRNDYVVRITNASHAPQDLTLAMHLDVANPQDCIKGWHACFSTSLTVQPTASTMVIFQYDWTGEVRFHCDGASYIAESSGGTTAAVPQLYRVTAIISDTAGKHLDELNVYQALAK